MITPTIATFVWDCVWQSTLWLALGGLAGLFWRHWPARAHRIMVLALLGCLATPFLSLIVRQSGWGLLSRSAPGLVRGFDDKALLGVAPRVGGEQTPATTPSTEESPSGASRSETTVQNAGASPKPRSAKVGVEISISPLEWFVYAWIALAAWTLFKLIISAVRELSILQQARPITEPKVQQALDLALAKLDLRGTQPRIRVSDRIRCPVIFCWGRQPTLLLPAGNHTPSPPSDGGEGQGEEVRSAGEIAETPLLGPLPTPSSRGEEGKSSDNLVGLLSHELAHWKRRDHWTALLGELAVCVLPWQPLVWWVKRRLEHFSELACDRWVLASGHSPETYAESLLGLAPQRDAMLALPAVKRRGKLENRIRRLFQGWQFDPTPGWKWASLATVASVSLAIALAAFQTQSNAASSVKDENAANQERTDVATTAPAGSTSLVIKKLDLPNEAQFGQLSPDLRRVARITVDDFQSIEIMELRSQVKVRLTDTTNQYPDVLLWSRDGSRLAFNTFLSARNTLYSLRLVSAVGGGVQTIYESKDFYPNPLDWSRDGRWILVALMGGASKGGVTNLVMISTDGGPTRPIIAQGWTGDGAKLSKDGRFIAFQRRNIQGRHGVFLLSIEDRREIPVGPPDRSNSSPHWSADGRYLLFKSNLSDAFELLGQEIVNGKLARDPVLIKSELGRSTQIWQVLDDGRLVYKTVSPGGGGTFRVAMNPETGEVTGDPRLIMAGGDGTPSPDGRWLAGIASGGLRVVSLDRNDQRTIGTEIENLKVYGWFPDGNSILVGGHGGTVPRGLHQFELATGKLTTVYTNIAVNSARLSSDGQMLVVDRGSQLFVVKPEVGETPIKVRSRGNSPSWSPDRSRIAFTIGAGRLAISLPNGEDLRELDHWENGRGGIAQTAWSPNGKHIVYCRRFKKAESDDEAFQVWIVPASGGEPVHLKSLDGFEAHNFHWGADGKELFFTGRDPKSGPATEYWTLENYLPAEKRAGL